MKTFFRSLLSTAMLFIFFVVSSHGQTTVTIGSGTVSSNYPYTTYWMDGKTDILITAAELTTAGASAGNITQIGFEVITAANQIMNGFNIKMQTTALTTLSAFTTTGWTTVYNTPYTVTATGWQMITLTTPFVWDGTSNLLIEICYDNTAYTAYSPVNSTAATGMAYGYYADVPSGSGCDFATGNVLINRPNTRLVVCANPAQPSTITGSATPCEGSSQVYSVTNVAGLTYAWIFPTGWTQTAGGTTNSVTVTVGTSSGNVSVTPSNACGAGTARTLAVTTTLLPAQPSTITGSTTPCEGSSQVYSVTNVAGVTYNWTFPTGWTQTAGGTTNSVTVTVGAGSGNVSVTPSTCANGIARTLAVTTALLPAQPSTITGSTTPCEGSSQSYSVTNVAGVTYAWTFPTGWTQTAGGTTNSITVTVGTGSGNVSVTPSTCGNGTARTLAVTTTLIPAQPSTITGNTTPYFGTSEIYSVTNVAGVIYTWAFPTGWVQTAGGTTNSVTATIGSGSGNVTCTPSNTCGDGTVRTLAVTVYGVGIQEFGTGKNITIMPNPTDGVVAIDFKGYSGNINLFIHNAQGVLISSEIITAQKDNFVKTMDLSKYPNGIYYLKFVNNGKTFVEKIVKL